MVAALPRIGVVEMGVPLSAIRVASGMPISISPTRSPGMMVSSLRVSGAVAQAASIAAAASGRANLKAVGARALRVQNGGMSELISRAPPAVRTREQRNSSLESRGGPLGRRPKGRTG